MIFWERILAEDDIPFLDYSLLLQASPSAGRDLLHQHPHTCRSATWSHTYSVCPASLRTAGKKETERELWTEPPMKPETFACLEESRLYRLALPHLVLSDLYTVHQSSNVEVIAQLWYCCNFRQRLFKNTYLGQWLHLTFSLD